MEKRSFIQSNFTCSFLQYINNLPDKYCLCSRIETWTWPLLPLACVAAVTSCAKSLIRNPLDSLFN